MRKNVRSRVEARGESLDLVESEVVYYKKKYFANAQGYFLLAFMFVIALLPAPSTLFGRIMGYLGIASVSVGVLYILFGVIHRGEIMQRYPLGKLYDTILVCTIAAVVVLLFMELLSRRKVCLAVSVVLGLMGMMLANRFEVGNGADTMQPLQAVLNKDYWLIIHVTCIIIGYAGGLVAAGLSTLYLLARMTGVDEGDKSFRRSMTRMAYGAACFTLIFALVGTILGGVWANDSWGRFWGWDPKENGALMIVLWFLALLHARLAGFIKEWGIHICMVLSANIIAFSWFGVNFLSTGLHSYGFASGGSGETWLNIYYILNAAIALVAFGFAWYEKEVKKMRRRDKELEKSANPKQPDQALDL
jgi:ABC-type transport system involved in cytochrome c biogenesis permease subunit